MTHQTATAARWTDHDLSRRVRGEYLEMPGLQLTLPQACRLWSVDPAAGRQLLDTLVAASFLRLNGAHYVRADTGRMCA